jgi:hypothetical protein
VLFIGTDQRITSGPAAKRLHSKAGYMAAPERFAERSDSFPLHRGRRPYMTHQTRDDVVPSAGGIPNNPSAPAATDRFAPKRSARRPGARQHPLQAVKSSAGKFHRFLLASSRNAHLDAQYVNDETEPADGTGAAHYNDWHFGTSRRQLSINKYTGYRWARKGATQLGRIVLNCS